MRLDEYLSNRYAVPGTRLSSVYPFSILYVALLIFLQMKELRLDHKLCAHN